MGTLIAELLALGIHVLTLRTLNLCRKRLGTLSAELGSFGVFGIALRALHL